VNIPQDLIRKEMALSRNNPNNEPTIKLQKYLYQITINMARKRCFSGYTFIDDMIQEAYFMLIKKWTLIDELDLTKSVFSYMTTTVERVFIGMIIKEGKRKENQYRLTTDNKGEYRVRDDNELDGYVKYKKKGDKSRSKYAKTRKINLSQVFEIIDKKDNE
jgi:hypothetical protein